jgi:prophage tail gpP-like protein
MMMMRLGLLIALLFGGTARAQDVPGIELCARENNIDRRTSCLQSNVDYLQKLIARNAAAAQQKLDAANVEIAALKAAVASLQASVDKLQSAATKPDSSATPDAK